MNVRAGATALAVAIPLLAVAALLWIFVAKAVAVPAAVLAILLASAMYRSD